MFSYPEDYDSAAGLNGEGHGKLLGQATGGGGLAWRDGALQDVRLGGATTMEGDLDMGGHRLLNFNIEGPDLDRLDVRQTPRRHEKCTSDRGQGAHGVQKADIYAPPLRPPPYCVVLIAVVFGGVASGVLH